MNKDEVLIEIKLLSTPDHFSKLAHFGINDSKALGVKIPLLRQLAKKLGKNHELALELWSSEVHEARLLATMIDDSKLVTESQFDSWVGDFNSWDICDQCCGLLSKTPYALSKIEIYSTSKDEFVKRAAFVLICALVINNKRAHNELFTPFFSIIEREAWDNRNFIKKAVNWALRQVGKRNEILRIQAIECAERILKQEHKSARWIASDALRELRNEKVVAMVRNRKA
jgi:3-methyladenine DNA glycosylase AlkD